MVSDFIAIKFEIGSLIQTSAMAVAFKYGLMVLATRATGRTTRQMAVED
jgi:hypothetical protein